MDEMEYPGLRLAVDAYLGDMVTPIKVDISTGDVITPRAVEYDYKLMLENSEGKTVVVVTHDESVAGVADRIIRIEDGRLLPA